MARATVQQVLTIVEGIRCEMDKLTMIIKGDPEKSVVGITTELELLKQRNRFEDRLANIAVGVGSALLIFLLTNGCTPIPNFTPTPGETQTVEVTVEPAETPTPPECVCPTVVCAPTPTATLMPTPGTPAPTPTPLPDLLLNSGFEGGTYQASPELFVPAGWKAWSSCEPGAVHSELEAHPPHVHGGRFAARVWQAFSTCEMGLYQRVDALPGATYQLEGYGFSWSTSNPVVGTPSEAWIKMWIGIDPLGGTDPQAASVVWSEENAARDIYGDFLVTVQARHTRLTVFLRSKPDWGLARNDTFWDDLALYEVELPAADATPIPTATPNILEVTPIGGEPVLAAGDKMEDVRGTYTPKGVMNVRVCTVAGVGCQIVGALDAGEPVAVYGRVTVYPSGDVWLCLDESLNIYGQDVGSQCARVVAYRLGETTFGELVLNEEK